MISVLIAEIVFFFVLYWRWSLRMPGHCDVVVIGAGPAGLMAGLEAVRAGAAVTIIEKDDVVGYPLNCAEAVTIPSLSPIVKLKSRWVRNLIERGRLVSPSGYSLELYHPKAGYVLDRPIMEQDLAEEFCFIGGTLLTGHRAVTLQQGETLFNSVVVVDEDERRSRLSADVFIAADGVEGTIARSAGIDNNLDLKTTEAYLQYRLRNVPVELDLLEFHLGSRIAPGSYRWVFPRGENELSVGLGVKVGDGPTPKELLDRYIAERFPEGEIVARSCGTAPRYQGPSKLAERNLLVVGDAARVLDSVTGAGIANAMLSGSLAGRAAASWCNGSTRDVQDLHKGYPRKFLEVKHSQLEKYRKVKEFLCRLTDQDFDEIVLGLNEFFESKTVDSINPIAVFLGVLKRKPRLLRLAGHLFSGSD